MAKLIFSDNSSDESFIHDDSSSDDEKPWVKEVKRQYRLIKKIGKQDEEEDESVKSNDQNLENHSRLFEIKDHVEFKDAKPIAKKQNKYVYINRRKNNNDTRLNYFKIILLFLRASLGDRLKNQEAHNVTVSGLRGNREMTFIIGKVLF